MRGSGRINILIVPGLLLESRRAAEVSRGSGLRRGGLSPCDRKTVPIRQCLFSLSRRTHRCRPPRTAGSPGIVGHPQGLCGLHEKVTTFCPKTSVGIRSPVERFAMLLGIAGPTIASALASLYCRHPRPVNGCRRADVRTRGGQSAAWGAVAPPSGHRSPTLAHVATKRLVWPDQRRQRDEAPRRAGPRGRMGGQPG